MSYNVDTWKTKELTDLVVPIAGLFVCPRKDWHPERKENADGTTTFRIGDGTYIKGRIVGESLNVTEISAQGECSGTGLHWIIEPALAHSTGKLVAVLVWEGGDSIDRLTVDNGKVSSEAIEL